MPVGYPRGRPRNPEWTPRGWPDQITFLREVIGYARKRRLLTRMAAAVRYKRADLYVVERGEIRPAVPVVKRMAAWYRAERRAETKRPIP